MLNKLVAPPIVVAPAIETVDCKCVAPKTLNVLFNPTAPTTDNVPPIDALCVTLNVDTDTSPDVGTFVKLEPSP